MVSTQADITFLAVNKTTSLSTSISTASPQNIWEQRSVSISIYHLCGFLERWIPYSPLFAFFSSPFSVFAFASLVSTYHLIVSLCVHFALSGLSWCSPLFFQIFLFPSHFCLFVLLFSLHFPTTCMCRSVRVSHPTDQWENHRNF